jgi:4-hydroxy-4-methyl-2-oxoglutarate aldolase
VLTDPALLTIRRRWPRPAPALLDKLRGAQTGHLVDAMQGRGALAAAIKPLDPANARFVGPACPCEPFADDNLAILAALSIAEPGDVLVAAADAFARSAVVGDNIARLARNKGLAAVVVDGMARDLDGIVEARLPVHARGITPNSCVRSGPGRVGLAIVAGGAAIAPGDVLVGDRDGVVVVPQDRLADVVVALEGIRRAEAEVQEHITAGLTQLDAIAALLSSDRVTWVD